MFEELIRLVAARGLTGIIYYCFHLMDFVAVIVYVIWIGKKLKLGLGKRLLIVLIVYPIGYLWMLILFWIESGFKNFGGQHMVSLFIYIPVIGLIASKVLRVDIKRVCFILAGCMPLVQTVGHLGCVFVGCCEGYEQIWGLYNIRTGALHFPIQLVESGVSAAIVIFLSLRAKRLDYIPDGKQYPIMLITYGSTRFICEFFRANDKILMGCSSLAFHALFMCIVGIAALIIVRRKKQDLLVES